VTAVSRAFERSQKTQVYERVDGRIAPVGHRMDGWCEGFLVGSFEALAAEGAVCAKEESPSPDFLLSVFQTYVGEAVDRKARPAAAVARLAFKRGFPCDRAKAR
jgi:hypothetical protein